MALTSMRLSKEEREGEVPTASSSDDGPIYPWGLTLHLDDTVLNKLGVEGLPAVGQDIAIVARAEVQSSSQTKTTEGSSRSVTLQITAMDAQASRDASESMFPSMSSDDGD